MFSRFNWEGLQQHWLQYIFHSNISLKGFHVLQLIAAAIFLDSTQWIPMGFAETKSSSAIDHWTFGVSKLEFPLIF